MLLEQISIIAWLQKNGIKTSNGLPVQYLPGSDYGFLYDIYRDWTPEQVGMKAAQVTYSETINIKMFYAAKMRKLDILYTLPSDSDVERFVGGKTNRIIANNPTLIGWVKDKDSVQQKRVGDNMVYFQGTWSKKAATMVSADLLIRDEVDASKQDVLEHYETRTQHSKYRWKWSFSHPSAEGFGIHKMWLKSDQKHWFVTCKACKVEQYLDWPESIDIDRQLFVCKACKAEITDDMRRYGRWVRKVDSPISGYWIPLLICPWVSAKQIIKDFNEKTEEYFYNKVLGLPYVGGGNKLTKALLLQNATGSPFAPGREERVILGIDTGLKLDYVLGTGDGLFYQGDADDYDVFDEYMKRWPKLIAIVDSGGDLIGSRKFREKYPGRVFLGALVGDSKNTDKFGWNDEERVVTIQRNKTIQLVVDEFADKRIPLHGSEEDWYEYFLDWDNLHRIKLQDPKTGESKGYKWVRSGRDHRALATVFYRAGIDRFAQAGQGKIIGGQKRHIQEGLYIEPNRTAKVRTPTIDDVLRARGNKQDPWQQV